MKESLSATYAMNYEIQDRDELDRWVEQQAQKRGQKATQQMQEAQRAGERAAGPQQPRTAAAPAQPDLLSVEGITGMVKEGVTRGLGAMPGLSLPAPTLEATSPLRVGAEATYESIKHGAQGLWGLVQEYTAAAKPKVPPGYAEIAARGVGGLPADLINNLVKPSAEMMKREHGVGPFALAKDVIDPILAIVMSPAAGFGAAVEQAAKNAAPEKLAEEWLPGGYMGAAHMLRGMMGEPVFSPNRKPEQRAQDTKPMTLGEVLNRVTSFAAMFALQPVGKAIFGRRGGPLPEPMVEAETQAAAKAKAPKTPYEESVESIQTEAAAREQAAAAEAAKKTPMGESIESIRAAMEAELERLEASIAAEASEARGRQAAVTAAEEARLAGEAARASEQRGQAERAIQGVTEGLGAQRAAEAAEARGQQRAFEGRAAEVTGAEEGRIEGQQAARAYGEALSREQQARLSARLEETPAAPSAPSSLGAAGEAAEMRAAIREAGGLQEYLEGPRRPAAAEPTAPPAEPMVTPEAPAFTPRDPAALERFVRTHGGIKPFELDVKGAGGEYAELPVRFKNKKKGMTPAEMAEAISEASGQPYDPATLMRDLIQLKGAKERAKARSRVEEAAEAAAAEADAAEVAARAAAEAAVPEDIVGGAGERVAKGLQEPEGSPARAEARDFGAWVIETVDAHGNPEAAKTFVRALPEGETSQTPGGKNLTKADMLALLEYAFPEEGGPHAPIPRAAGPGAEAGPGAGYAAGVSAPGAGGLAGEAGGAAGGAGARPGGAGAGGVAGEPGITLGMGFGALGEKIPTALLARMAFGAVVGCMSAGGEDPEKCAQRALLGAGIMAPMSAKLAAQMGQRLAAARAKAQVSPGEKLAQRSGVALQAGEEAFQPNYARLDLTPALKNYMVNIHRSIKEDILARKGPAHTQKQVVRDALAKIDADRFTVEDVLKLGDETVLNDVDITAARILSKRSFEFAMDTRDRINAGEFFPEGTYKSQVALAGAMGRNTRVAQTRQAQALKANDIKIGNESVAYRPEEVAHLAENIHPEWTDAQLAALHVGIKNPAQMGRVATFTSLFPRMALDALYFGYLSGDAIAKNLVGNHVMFGLKVMDTAVGRYMPTWDYNWVPSWIRRTNHPTVGPIMAGEATASARALGEAWIDHIRMLRHLDQIDVEATRLGVNRNLKKSERREPAFRETSQRVFGAAEGSPLDIAGDWADKTVTFTSKVLDTTDIASRSIQGRIALREEAMHQAAREGHGAHGDPAFEARVNHIVQNVTELSALSRQRITEAGARGTYTREFQGRMLRALAAGPENDWLNLVYRATVLPFFRITAWITQEAMTRSPGLNMIAADFYRDWRGSIADRQRAQGRVVSGALMMGGFMYLESQGLLTGTKPKDPRLAKLWEDAGFQERSWRLPGMRYRSYDGLGSITNLLSAAADTSAASRRLGQNDYMHLFVNNILSQINNLDSRTFTQSLSRLMDVIKTQAPDDQVDKAMDFIRRQATSMVRPGVAREIEGAVDPARRPAVRSGKFAEDSLSGTVQREFQMALDEIRATWPGWSSVKDQWGNYLVPPDTDPITGDDTIASIWPFLPFGPARPVKPLPFNAPANMPKGYETDVRKELLRLNGAGLNVVDPWIGGSNPGTGSGFGPQNLNEGVRLSGQARYFMSKAKTQQVRDDDGHTYPQALKAMMESEFYWAQSDGRRGTDGGKAQVLQAIEAGFRKEAEEVLQNADTTGTIRRKIQEKQIERKVMKVPTADQPEARGMLESILGTLGGR